MLRLTHPAMRRSAALSLAARALSSSAVSAAASAAASASTPRSEHGGACPSRLAGAEVSAVAGRRRFDPLQIYPSQAGVVRICNNTIRDAQQSNLSAEMAHCHRVQVAKLVDACYSKTKGPPGVEQIWGGTVPMFDSQCQRHTCQPLAEQKSSQAVCSESQCIVLLLCPSLCAHCAFCPPSVWKRGVHPFDGLREVTALLPNTPTSMLVRSNSLNSMSAQPRDVVSGQRKQ